MLVDAPDFSKQIGDFRTRVRNDQFALEFRLVRVWPGQYNARLL